MKYYYHATPMDNAGSILREGLRPGPMGVVFMTEDPNEALRFPVFEKSPNEFVVFQIETHDDDEIEETFDHNERFFQCRCFGFSGTIPPDRLKMFSYYSTEQ